MKWLLILLSIITFSLSSPAKQPEDPRQIYCLAENIYHEARGEPLQGQLAVAKVTLNRVQNSKWPNTICKVVYQKNQFSWTNYKKKKVIITPQLLAVAKEAQNFKLNAVYYHSIKVKPVWRHKLRKVAVIGNHVFYTDKV